MLLKWFMSGYVVMVLKFMMKSWQRREKIYDVIAAKWTGKFKKDILYHHIGEKLFEKKDPLLKLHIQNKIRQLDKIINEMENMKKRDLEKRKEYINLKEKYEKALTTI